MRKQHFFHFVQSAEAITKAKMLTQLTEEPQDTDKTPRVSESSDSEEYTTESITKVQFKRVSTKRRNEESSRE